jgi:SAM-dependent methyltransferase
LGHDFTREAWGGIHSDYVVTRHRCENCGFEFFNPSLAGNEAFYRELEHVDYFPGSRAEFVRTLDFAEERGSKRVLDVGCGDGIFLDLARTRAWETHGIELNSAAADKARAKGHKIYRSLLHQLDSNQTSGAFDLITFFQVVEHVPDPAAVLKDAARLLTPDGFISIAVPSAQGVYRLVPWDPHQWPPHHISRWRLSDFEQLACATNLKLSRSGGDRLLGSEIEHFWKLHNRLAPVLNKKSIFGGDAVPKLVSLMYRKAGLKFFFPEWGNSIYGFFQKL